MSSLNGVTYICSAGLSSVTSAGALGPYFALTYFLPVYDFRIDKTICDTSALSISSLGYSSATHNSLSALEKIYNNPELFGQGSYNILNFNTMYSRGTSGSGPLFTNTRQRNGDNKVNVLNGKVLQNQVSAVGFSNISSGQLSATGIYTSLTGTSVNSWNPLSASSVNWNYQNLFRVTSYSPNQSTSGIASGNYKCRIPAGSGSFKFNMLAIYATRVNQYGYSDPGVVGSPYNPTLFAIVAFDTPQVKSDTAGSLNAFEANIELTFSLASSAASPVYVNTDYFTRVPTSNTTSAYALNYDGDVVISSSASPGSWVPRAKLTITDPEKDQVRLAHDETRFTNITTNRFKPYSSYPESAEMAVLDIDTSCPDDALLQIGYNCVATGIKSIAMGCYTSALGYSDSGATDFGQANPTIPYLYYSERGGYTLATGVESLAQGLVSTSMGFQTSAIGFASFAGGYASVAASDGMDTTYYSNPSEGMNFAYGFKTSAIADTDVAYPGGYSPSSLSNWFSGFVGSLVGGNFATNIQTLAKGNGNASFNINTVAYGTGNNAFGMNTSALGILSIATGLSNIADGILSQSHGQYTSANGILSYVYGGLAKADVNAHGSFTFGSPYIYGSGGGSTTTYFPDFYTKIWNGQSEQISYISESSQQIDKYTNTYNDGMGTFVFGQGSSAYTQALQSFIGGVVNKTSSQGTTIFGACNTIGLNSKSSSIVGGKNTTTTSKYSNVIGFFNTVDVSNSSVVVGISNSATNSIYSNINGINNKISNSVQTFVIGADNIFDNGNYSLVVGNRNIVGASIYSSVFGNNNNISGTYNGIFGNNNTISFSTNSYAIGNNVSISNSMNSVAIGYGATVDTNNIVKIGSCAITSAAIEAKNIVLDAKSCSTTSNRTKISLKADEIELDGYTGNIERYKYSIYIHRVRYNNEGSNTNNSHIVIKVFRCRCDNYSGKIDSVSFKSEILRDGSVKYIQTNTTPKTQISKIIKFIMFNPISMDFIYGDKTEYSSIDTYIKNGYRLLAIAKNKDTDEHIARGMSAEYYLFNDIVKADIYTTSNDEPVPSIDDVYGAYSNYDEQTFTSTITDERFNLVAQGRTGSGDTDSKITFHDRTNKTISVSSYGKNVISRGKTFSCFNGLIGPSSDHGPYYSNISADDSLSVLTY